MGSQSGKAKFWPFKGVFEWTVQFGLVKSTARCLSHCFDVYTYIYIYLYVYIDCNATCPWNCLHYPISSPNFSGEHSRKWGELKPSNKTKGCLIICLQMEIDNFKTRQKVVFPVAMLNLLDRKKKETTHRTELTDHTNIRSVAMDDRNVGKSKCRYYNPWQTGKQVLVRVPERRVWWFGIF